MRMKIKTERSVAAFSLRALRGAEEAGLLDEARGTIPSAEESTNRRGQPTTVEELLITAQKRESTLQDTPISITAFDSEMLIDRDVTSVGGISHFVPNLTMHTNAGGNTGVTVNIRGAVTTSPRWAASPIRCWNSVRSILF
ncbi:MAG: TonB-dependent receptor plug domain-containing protein [Deltaproteobacteria bacterium]